MKITKIHSPLMKSPLVDSRLKAINDAGSIGQSVHRLLESMRKVQIDSMEQISSPSKYTRDLQNSLKKINIV